MNLELITTFENLELLQNEWNSLLPHNATNEIFLTWEWQSTWWQIYKPGDLWVVAARDESNRLVGLAPWFIYQPERVVRTIGCVEVTDYLDLLVLPEARDEFYAAITEFLALDVFPHVLTENGFTVEVKHEDVCPYIPLPADFEGYLQQLDKKQRHEIRRKLRRAEEHSEGGEKIAWYIVGPEDNLPDEMEKFMALMAASHPNKAQFLQDSHNRAFFRAITPRLAACGWLMLSFLTVNDQPAAAYLNFDYNNRVLVYNSGLLSTEFAHLSPGIVLLTYIIQYAIAQGRSVFDFLQGNEEYKYRMGGQDREVLILHATRNQEPVPNAV